MIILYSRVVHSIIAMPNLSLEGLTVQKGSTYMHPKDANFQKFAHLFAPNPGSAYTVLQLHFYVKCLIFYIVHFIQPLKKLEKKQHLESNSRY